MKKYNSLEEMEKAKAKQKENYNKACVRAMTDEELQTLYNFIDEEITNRALDDLKISGKQ